MKEESCEERDTSNMEKKKTIGCESISRLKKHVKKTYKKMINFTIKCVTHIFRKMVEEWLGKVPFNG